VNRRLLTSRWLAAHAAVVVAVIACAALGWWQLDRAREQHAQSLRPAANSAAPPVPLDSLLRPGQPLRPDAIGRAVIVEGEYDASAQVLVPRREVGGESGYAVVTPLVVDGTAVVVVRGWVPTSDSPAPPVASPPAGRVRVTGRLGPGEEPPPLAESLPPGQLGSVHLPSLLNLAPYPIYDAVVTRTAESPAPREPLAALTTHGAVDGSWPLQNVFYAIEWWVFGLAAVALWVSAVRRRPAGRVATDPLGRKTP